jgi:hypothetical protein
MRDLLDHEMQDVRAAEAVALFCYQVKKWVELWKQGQTRSKKIRRCPIYPK